MIDMQNDLDDEDEELSVPSPQVTRKKMLLVILPIVIVIGLLVSFYTVFSKQDSQSPKNYQVVDQTTEASSSEKNLILYDLPEIEVMLNSRGDNKKYARLKLNIELSDTNQESIKTLEAFIPRINDIVTSHLIETYPEEIETAQGLYWLKEDLLYRINLVTKPLKVSNINLKMFEIKTSN